MTLQQIQDRLKAIEDAARDPEKAHIMEDMLQLDFIAYVATLRIPVALKAKEVLKSSEIDFPRWRG